MPTKRTDSDAAVQAAAERLLQAQSSRTPCAPVRDLIRPTDARAAYAVQETVAARRRREGAIVVGRKVGLTNRVVQHQLGVDQPDFGLLLDHMQRVEDDVIPLDTLLQPRIEAEVAFVLAEDLDGADLGMDVVRSAVADCLPALEIVDSRIANWDISFADTVADNGSSAMFVLGATRASLDTVEPREVDMTLRLGGEVVSTGNGSACLGDPLEALRWLALTLRDMGQPLRTGEVVLSGALGPMVPVVPGGQYVAEITGLGTVRATFASTEEPT